MCVAIIGGAHANMLVVAINVCILCYVVGLWPSSAKAIDCIVFANNSVLLVESAEINRLFQFILSHITLLNQPKSAGFST